MICYNWTPVPPPTQGVYACRVPCDEAPELLEDKFFMRYDGAWWYLGSDQKYRGDVVAWLGPLERRKPKAAT